MSTHIIIVFCVLILIAYFFDLTASKTKIPSVILLMLLGWVAQQFSIAFEVIIPDLSETLHVFGSVGLVLIVLEGTLDLEIDKQSLSTIKKSILMSILPLLLITLLIALLLIYFLNVDLRIGIINALPFSIISSAIAIPSARNLSSYNKNFITYESSFSDIVGVTLFNFITLNTIYNFKTFSGFLLELVVIILISVVSTVFLSFILGRLKHHVKFVPILITVVLIYAVTKLFHLPALIFIVVFGLTLGNVEKITELLPIQNFNPGKLKSEVKFFRDLVAEATFLIRTIFFIIFGFLVKSSEIVNLVTLPWAIAIISIILLLRAISLRILNLKIFPLLFIAPRGLITILLFVSISPLENIELVNNALVLQVIVLSVLIMMFGIMFFGENEKHTIPLNPSLNNEPEDLNSDSDTEK